MTYHNSIDRLEKRINNLGVFFQNKSFKKALIKLIEAIYLSNDNKSPLSSVVSDETFNKIISGKFDKDITVSELLFLFNYYKVKFKFKPNKTRRNDIRNVYISTSNKRYNDDENEGSHGITDVRKRIISFCIVNNLDQEKFLNLHEFMVTDSTVFRVQYPELYDAFNSIVSGELNMEYMDIYTNLINNFGINKTESDDSFYSQDLATK